MIESYVRVAPKRHQLYQGNLEVRGYACREYGGQCAEWFLREALRPNGHAPVPEGPDRAGQTEEHRRPIPWHAVAVDRD